MSNNLAIKLRSGTQHSHAATENIGFMKCFVKGVVDRNCFAKFLGNLYFVYGELESALESHKNHPCISVLYFPELNRKANLHEDLEFYYGSDWLSQIKPSVATENYVSRIRELSEKQPELLIGHAYTRYMGDLSGGQMLQRVVQSTLKLTGYQGTSFYNFEQIPDKKVFKDKYREALDKVPVDDTTADKIVVEANNSFQFNMQMAKELEAILIQSIGEEKFRKLINNETATAN
ncbi:heme oxygenase (biliverdin-producing) [Rivularia sp. UHCC 0363]|uniref:biliverdin-producing heme oxygenase n=1 Tax=Rivularia sp. UHCC 0363 TaxID=3110244 RepID=UPI002B21C427|nr:heme oxygenase (biliverdin-producing) [Rivularia sp. UHCC 0363]MEA5593724.1 heme oxygenase (biliverdin-producing) [Rivularia sp. UHCC 0363]